MEGPFARRRIYTRIGFRGKAAGGPGDDTYGNRGRALIRGILESARGVRAARMYQIKSELDADGVYEAVDVEKFCSVYFKPKQRQSPTDHQLMNAALDPAVARFKDLQNSAPDEAEL